MTNALVKVEWGRNVRHDRRRRRGQEMTRTLTATALAFTALILPAVASPAVAQGAPAAEAHEIFEVNQEVLKRLATVYPLVIAIAEEAKPRMDEAETEAVARAIEELARDRIEAILEAVEFTPQQYMAVVRVLNNNEALRDDFQRYLDEAWAEPAR
jgi:hypothetical protein